MKVYVSSNFEPTVMILKQKGHYYHLKVCSRGFCMCRLSVELKLKNDIFYFIQPWPKNNLMNKLYHWEAYSDMSFCLSLTSTTNENIMIFFKITIMASPGECRIFICHRLDKHMHGSETNILMTCLKCLISKQFCKRKCNTFIYTLSANRPFHDTQ